MQQQTEAWLAWRAKGLGASDAPAMMGLIPKWKTRQQLLEEKAGKRTTQYTRNPAQERGVELEPLARAYYELYHDIEMSPITLQHPRHAFLLASMDGWNCGENRGLEIKCPGAKDHGTAVGGTVPEKYYYQLIHQFLVSGAERIDYFSYKSISDYCTLTVYRDERAVEEYLGHALAFWDEVRELAAGSVELF